MLMAFTKAGQATANSRRFDNLRRDIQHEPRKSGHVQKAGIHRRRFIPVFSETVLGHGFSLHRLEKRDKSGFEIGEEEAISRAERAFGYGSLTGE
jgi:hypothetical protein